MRCVLLQVLLMLICLFWLQHAGLRPNSPATLTAHTSVWEALLRSCVGTCINGECEYGQCACPSSWTGPLCEQRVTQSPGNYLSLHASKFVLEKSELDHAITGVPCCLKLNVYRSSGKLWGAGGHTFYGVLRGPEIIPLTFVDHNDGRYSASLSFSFPGTYNLTIISTGMDYSAYSSSIDALVVANNVQITVRGSTYARGSSLPCAANHTSAGRWVQEKLLHPSIGNWSLMAEFDPEAYVWIPDSCIYQYFETFPPALHNRVLTLLGDSHTRVLYYVFFNFFFPTAPFVLKRFNFTLPSTNTTVRYVDLQSELYNNSRALQLIIDSLTGSDFIIANSAQWTLEFQGVSFLKRDLSRLFLLLYDFQQANERVIIIWQSSPAWNPITRRNRTQETVLIAKEFSEKLATQLGFMTTDCAFQLSLARRTEAVDNKSHFSLPYPKESDKLANNHLRAPVVYSQLQVLLNLLTL